MILTQKSVNVNCKCKLCFAPFAPFHKLYPRNNHLTFERVRECQQYAFQDSTGTSYIDHCTERDILKCVPPAINNI